MSRSGPNPLQRLFRGETSFDFAGRWRRWFAISGLVIFVGLVSLGIRGVNFSIDFKGGTQWQVPSTASVAEATRVVDAASRQVKNPSVQILTNHQTNQRTVQVSLAAQATANSKLTAKVTQALANMAHVSTNSVQLDAIGPSWGSSITSKAIKAVVIFLVLVSGYIWLRFEGKMAVAALVALLHDILVTVGIYSLSGFQVSPDTVIAFLTILGYSLYDTIVVFDKVQENTRGLASTNRLTYTDTVNISMNQVLARSLNTSLVAIIPILSILVIGSWVLGATALNNFGLALFIGLTTGAYSSIFIASPLLGLLKEREPRYAEIRRRLVNTGGGRRITPAAAALGDLSGHAPTRGSAPVALADRVRGDPAGEPLAPGGGKNLAGANTSVAAGNGNGNGDRPDREERERATPLTRTPVPPRTATRPPPRPRKKGRKR
ncbi:MAG: protein translocase subunit SecF [Acidimicrobiales bacterium]